MKSQWLNMQAQPLRGFYHLLKNIFFLTTTVNHQSQLFSPFQPFLVVVYRNILQNEMVQLHGCTHVSCDAVQLHSAGELDSVPQVHTRPVTHSASNSFTVCHILQSNRARVLVGIELSAASHVSARTTLHNQSSRLRDPFPSSRLHCHFPPDFRVKTSCILSVPQRRHSYLSVASWQPRPLCCVEPAHFRRPFLIGQV